MLWGGDGYAIATNLDTKERKMFLFDVKARASEPPPLVTDRWWWRVFFPVYDRTPRLYL